MLTCCHWQVAQTISHVILGHMSSSRVMHRSTGDPVVGEVKHKVKKKNIATT